MTINNFKEFSTQLVLRNEEKIIFNESFQQPEFNVHGVDTKEVIEILGNEKNVYSKLIDEIINSCYDVNVFHNEKKVFVRQDELVMLLIQAANEIGMEEYGYVNEVISYCKKYAPDMCPSYFVSILLQSRFSSSYAAHAALEILFIADRALDKSDDWILEQIFKLENKVAKYDILEWLIYSEYFDNGKKEKIKKALSNLGLIISE